MKCIYCEANETKGELLCYGCQVDLFPLVSAWAYCGACGSELPVNSTTCPRCTTAENPTPIISAEPTTKVAASLIRSQFSEEQRAELPVASLPSQASQAVAIATPTTPREGVPKKPPASQAEIAKARRFQFLIRSVFGLLWLIIVVLILWWAKHLANQPVSPIIP